MSNIIPFKQRKNSDGKHVTKAVEEWQKSLQGLNISSFQKQFRRLKKQVGSSNKDFSSDKSAIALFRAYLAMIIQMIPVLQTKFHKTGRGVYELTQLITLSIEISNILRALGDKSEMANRIMSDILDPNLALILQNLNGQMTIKKRELAEQISNTKTRKKINRILRQIMREQMEFIGALRSQLNDQMIKVLAT